MANELQFYGHPVLQTGLNITATLINCNGVEVATNIIISETGTLL